MVQPVDPQDLMKLLAEAYYAKLGDRLGVALAPPQAIVNEH
jgi:hypothetical protein